MRFRRILKLVVLNIITVAAVLIFINYLGIFSNIFKSKIEHTHHMECFDFTGKKIPDHNFCWDYSTLLGIQQKANGYSKHQFSYNNKEIFNVVYHHDKFGRRDTPQKKNKSSNKFALFFGGSFTYGEGVEDTQTFPSHFADIAKDFNAYNYGLSASGPNYMLLQIQKRKLLDEIKERRGIAIYTVIEDHLYRAVGESSNIEIHDRMPYYSFENKKLMLRGNFVDNRELLTKFYHLYSKTAFSKEWKIRFPLRLSEQDMAVSCSIISESRKRLNKLFPGIDFLVILHGFVQNSNQQRFRECLDRDNIRYLVFEYGKSELPDGINTIAHDGHPNSQGHLLLAKFLNNYL